jgi:hypothetical protein
LRVNNCLTSNDDFLQALGSATAITQVKGNRDYVVDPQVVSVAVAGA